MTDGGWQKMWYDHLLIAAEVIGALLVIGGFLWFFVNLYLKIEQIGKDTATSKEEREIIMDGLLACLLALAEKGCNGEVTKSIDKIGQFLNKQAHR
jgi:hypothetical protein